MIDYKKSPFVPTVKLKMKRKTNIFIFLGKFIWLLKNACRNHSTIYDFFSNTLQAG